MITINLKGDWITRQVKINGKILSPAKSQKVRNHSPDGFAWGYGGSGPAQLALAILLEFYDKETMPNYQDFKFKVIGALPQSDFEVEVVLPENGKDGYINGN